MAFDKIEPKLYVFDKIKFYQDKEAVAKQDKIDYTKRLETLKTGAIGSVAAGNEALAEAEKGEIYFSITKASVADFSTCPELVGDLNNCYTNAMESAKTLPEYTTAVNSAKTSAQSAIAASEQKILETEKLLVVIDKKLELYSKAIPFYEKILNGDYWDPNDNYDLAKLNADADLLATQNLLKDSVSLINTDIKDYRSESTKADELAVVSKDNFFKSRDDANNLSPAVQKIYDECVAKLKEKCPGITPTDTTTPTPDATPTNCTYTVVSGDNLTKIAAAQGCTLNELIALNPQIKNIDLIYPGDIINVPCKEDKPAEQPPEDTTAVDATKAAENGVSLGEIKDGIIQTVEDKKVEAWIKMFDESLPNITSTVNPTPFWAAGHSEVIMMNYALSMGPRSALNATFGDTMLAHTYSFLEGVSLSEISWGFVNSASSAGDKANAYLKFTLHDIAGSMFSNFIKIRSSAMAIYFYGPMSDGNIWSGGNAAVYTPITQDCNMEFSPTQGFTYTFICQPLDKLIKTEEYLVPKQIDIDGTYDGKAVTSTGNLFKDYIMELEHKWNAGLTDDKKNTARIEFDYADASEGAQSQMWQQTPTQTEKVAGTNDDTKTNVVTPYVIPSGTNLAVAIRGLWQERFSNKENTTIEVNFKDYDGSRTLVNLKLHIPNVTTPIGVKMPYKLCVGDDINCIGIPFRGNLANISFGKLFDTLGGASTSSTLGSSETAIAAGNDSKVETATPPEEKGADNMTKVNKTDVSYSTGPAPGANQGGFDAWGKLKEILNSTKSPELVIEIDMPYTFAFSPQNLGGMLKNSQEGFITTGIHPVQGVDFEFYWYSDPTCSFLDKMDVISTEYRLAGVQHTIGLNGNSTQVKLTHLQLTS